MRSAQPAVGRPRALFRLLALIVAVTVMLGACSGTEDDASDSASSDDSAEAAETMEDVGVEAAPTTTIASEEPEVASDEVADRAGSGGLSEAAGLPVDTGRDIIFTASVDVEVEDVVVAGQEATTAIAALGGVLFGQVTTSEGVPRSTLIFKVPPSQFQTALVRLGDIGFLRDQIITADDVTERVVDLESQIITAQLSVDRLRGFLEQATTLTEIADLEQQLLVRETSLEQLRGQLRTIEGQVSSATITVSFRQKLPGPELTIEQTAYLGHDDGTTCPGLDEIEGDEDDLVTVCYRITNTGDTLLDDLDVRDEGLQLELDDLAVVDGSLDEPLAIGASVTLVAEIEARPFEDGRAQATALPVAEGGTDLLLGRTSARDDLEMQIEEDTSLPGFLDGLSTGWAALQQIIGVVVLVAGFALPFIWVIPLAWFGRRWLRRRRAANMPPPPAATPAPSVGPEAVGVGVPSSAESDSAESDRADGDSVERREGPEVEG